MKKIIPLFLITIMSTFFTSAQTTKIDKDDNIYLTINKNESFLVKNINYKDNTISLSKEHTLNIKRTTIDVYLNWINPLQYKLVIQDSIINDLRVEEIKKFFSESFTGLAGGNSLIKPGASLGNKAFKDCSSISSKNLQTILDNDSGFDNDALQKSLRTDIKTKLNNLNKSYEECIKTYISSLYKVDNYKKAKELSDLATELIKEFGKSETKTIANLYQLNELIARVDSKMGITKSELKDYYSTLNTSFENSKKLVEFLKLYIIQVETSFKNMSKDFENHFRIKNIALPRSKSINLTFNLSERELKDDFSIVDKSTSKTHKILVQKYDFITPKIGTGIFYSSTTLNGFGVTTNDQDVLIVTKNDIEKNNAVTGVFLNLNFDIGSQFLEPLLQIGVDPTKEKPYLLIGGGFSIPVSNFSISAGPIWTWEASLNKLSLNDAVTSTSVLEDDIEYKFQTSPRGFYLGLNYSF